MIILSLFSCGESAGGALVGGAVIGVTGGALAAPAVLATIGLAASVSGVGTGLVASKSCLGVGKHKCPLLSGACMYIHVFCLCKNECRYKEHYKYIYRNKNRAMLLQHIHQIHTCMHAYAHAHAQVLRPSAACPRL
jgi:hypothetical protein